MKHRYLAIVAAAGIPTIVFLGVLFFTPSIIPGTYQYAETTGLDLSNPSTDNPLGIRAQVVIEPDMALMMTVSPTPHLILTSQDGVEFIGYRVCDGISCKQDKIRNAPYVHMNEIPQNYTGPTALLASPINLGNLQWQAGDNVHVIVKAYPVTLEQDNALVRYPLKTMVVDLGKSKIIRYNATAVQKNVLENDTSVQMNADKYMVGSTVHLDYVKAFLAKYPNAIASVSNQYGPSNAVVYSINSTVLGGTNPRFSQYSTLMLVIPMNSGLPQVDETHLLCITTAGISSMGTPYWPVSYKDNQSLVPFETALDRERCLK